MADEPLARVGKGDPITADWANAVADAINGRGASDPNANGTATPYGVMTPADTDTQMRAPDAQAMPFDAAIIREGSDGDALYMALPSGPDYVFYGADAVAPDAAQTMGTALNAWVRIEAVTNNTARYVSLGLTKPQSGSSSSQPPTWRLFVASSPTARPGWADPEKPVVLLAGYNIAADDPSGADTTETDTPSLLKGLVQYHRGTVNLGDGGGDDWIPDSFAEQYLSLDPPSVALIYETEQVQETVTQTYGKGVDGQPLTRQVTVTKTVVKTDADGNPVPATDEQGQPLTTPAMYHQIHNFDSANDGALLELADENGSGGALVCTRATDGAGFAEVKWRRIPRTPPPCIPTYSLDERAGQGCAEKTIVLKRTDYAKNSAGECVEGATVVVGCGVAVPKPPEYTLSASSGSSGGKVVTLYRTPCGGQQTPAGSVTIDGAALCDSAPQDAVLSTGTASAGTATAAARCDHIHKLPATVVDTINDQTVGGNKTFSNGLAVAAGKRVSFPSASGWSIHVPANGDEFIVWFNSAMRAFTATQSASTLTLGRATDGCLVIRRYSNNYTTDTTTTGNTEFATVGWANATFLRSANVLPSSFKCVSNIYIDGSKLKKTTDTYTLKNGAYVKTSATTDLLTLGAC